MVSLRDHINDQFMALDRLLDERKEAQEAAIAAALASVKEAMLKAETANERRFASVNEFRGTLTDQAATFATREAVDLLRDDMNRRNGSSAGVAALIGYIVGAVGVMGIIVTLILRAGGQ